MAHIQLKSLTKAYGALEVIKGIDLEIKKGEFMVFVGPSGCGKSTLLRLISGLEQISSGTLLFDDEEVNNLVPSKRGIAMVFQSYALYPNMTVKQNIAFGLQQTKMPKSEIEQRVEEASTLLKLGPLMQRRPSQLSGGQSQRVAIGRAIVRHPEIFLFDEPLSNLDAELRVHMRVELVALHQRLRKTMIYVTHDQVEAMTMADRIVVFSAGQIEQVGTPLELYNSPDNEFVAGFLGSPRMNFFEEVSRSGETVTLAGGTINLDPNIIGQSAGKIKIGLRPEHIEIGATEAFSMNAKVKLVEQLGGENFIYAEVADGQSMVIKQQGQKAPKNGEVIGFGPRDGHVYAFDSETTKCLMSLTTVS